MRFATHVGVLEEMFRWNDRATGTPWLERFDVIVGTSAGALVGALYAAGYEPPFMARLARLFADHKFGRRLFDFNVGGLAASYLRSDSAAMLGGIRGRRLLTLLEALFSKNVRHDLQALGPNVDLGEELLRLWGAHKRLKRTSSEFRDDQLTFADCRRRLFLIGTNALSGQKTVFCRFPAWDKGLNVDEFEELAFNATHPEQTYIGGLQPIRDAVKQVERELGLPDGKLTFQRLPHRAYTQFDPNVYGNVLPIAVAVRASLSVQGLFEPVRIRRQPQDGAAREDLFVDGGIDDTFSLSVAVDRFFGAAGEVLGVSLGNLGYRLPDERAVDNVPNLLNRTTHYMGDAQLDFAQTSASLSGHPVTIINALSGNTASFTDTDAIAKLVDEGAEIARGFATAIDPAAPAPPARVPIDPSAVFQPGVQRVYLSPAARIDRDALKRALAARRMRGKHEDVRPWNVVPPFPMIDRGPDGRWRWRPVWLWILLSLAIFLLGGGFGNLLVDVIDRARARPPAAPMSRRLTVIPPIALRSGIATVIATRLVALYLWLANREIID